MRWNGWNLRKEIEQRCIDNQKRYLLMKKNIHKRILKILINTIPTKPYEIVGKCYIERNQVFHDKKGVTS